MASLSENIQPPCPVHLPAFAPSGSAGGRGPYFYSMLYLLARAAPLPTSCHPYPRPRRGINMAIGMGFWSNHVVPHLIDSGAIDGPMAAGKKTLQRLRWLFIVAQFDGVSTQRHCVKLGNAIRLEEDLVNESNTDDSDELSDETR